MMILLVFGLIVVVGGILLLWLFAGNSSADESTVEPETHDPLVELEPRLAEAELAYVERKFRCTTPYTLVARVDRAYKLKSGLHTLIEKKTRKTATVYDGDILQLSLQAYVLRKNNKPTDEVGYVYFEEQGVLEKVNLYDDARCEAAIARFIAIRNETQKPNKSIGPKCRRCAYVAMCKT